MQHAIEELGRERVITLVNDYATQLGVPTELHIEHVCEACCNNPTLAPNMNARRTTTRMNSEQSILQWVTNFKRGYDGRISVRHSNMPGTTPDGAISIILETILPHNQHTHIHQLKIIHAHRLCMSAENILGLLLEEFLFNKLSEYGWFMAWGETIKSVDFCNVNGQLLQIKNRSNSENSSSKIVREDTNIKKWFRANAYSTETNWPELVKFIVNEKAEADHLNARQREELQDNLITQLNENEFQAFIQMVLQNNPDAFAIEPGNLWLEDN